MRIQRRSLSVRVSGLALTFFANASIMAAGQKARFSITDRKRTTLTKRGGNAEQKKKHALIKNITHFTKGITKQSLAAPVFWSICPL